MYFTNKEILKDYIPTNKRRILYLEIYKCLENNEIENKSCYFKIDDYQILVDFKITSINSNNVKQINVEFKSIKKIDYINLMMIDGINVESLVGKLEILKCKLLLANERFSKEKVNYENTDFEILEDEIYLMKTNLINAINELL